MPILENKVIYLYMYGGLGNQIFQLFAAIILATKKKISRIEIDESYLLAKQLKGQIEEVLNFEAFGIEITYRKKLITKLRLPRFLKIKSKFNPFVSDGNFYRALNSAPRMNFYLDGYFIDAIDQGTFDRHLKLISKGFRLKSLDSEVNFKNRCVIHLRGTDFIKLGWSKITPLGYYKSSIQKMVEIGIDSFDVVTDDINYAKSFFDNNSYIKNYISTDLISDFFYISKFQYKILSPSTFAFWASVFGVNRTGKKSLIIAPSFWSPDLRRKIRLKNEINLSVF